MAKPASADLFDKRLGSVNKIVAFNAWLVTLLIRAVRPIGRGGLIVRFCLVRLIARVVALRLLLQLPKLVLRAGQLLLKLLILAFERGVALLQPAGAFEQLRFAELGQRLVRGRA